MVNTTEETVAATGHVASRVAGPETAEGQVQRGELRAVVETRSLAPTAATGENGGAAVTFGEGRLGELRLAASGLDRITVTGQGQSTVTVRDTRIPVAQVLRALSDLRSPEAVTSQFPGLLEPEDIEQSLTFASRLAS